MIELGYTIERLVPDHIEVRDQFVVRGGSEPYCVSLSIVGKWSCTCKDWTCRRKAAGEDCKHIEMAMSWMERNPPGE